MLAGSFMVTFASKSGKYSLEADVELDKLLTAEPKNQNEHTELNYNFLKPPLDDEADSIPSFEFSELDFDSVTSESSLGFLVSIS